MLLPFLVFWILIIFTRGELGVKGVAISIGVWLGLLIGFMCVGISSYVFVAAQALLDVVLILAIFSGDITIR